ncbi:MAG: ABC transporter permease [Anaerolineae bacterium]|nr:ABC transporter permease [Anaerolineae bacterium]
MTAKTYTPAAATVRLRRLPPPLIALILAGVLFLVGGLAAPGFANPNQAINIARLAAFLGIISIGQTLVIISGNEGIDLSAGALVTLGAILTFRISGGQNEMIPVALAAVLLTGAAVGLINGLAIAFLKMPPLVMTLGMAGVVTGLIYLVTRGELIGDDPPLLGQLFSEQLIGPVPGVIILWLLIGVVMWVVLERTTYGKHLFAIGVNRTTARLSGVRVTRTLVITYTLAGALAAFAGFVLLAFTKTVFLNLGDPYLFPSIIAVVVGGTLLSGGKGSYWGTMAGALVLQVLTSLLRALGIEPAGQMVIYGVILLLIITFYGRQRSLRQ